MRTLAYPDVYVREILAQEIAQRREEGCRVEEIEREYAQIKETGNAADFESLYHALSLIEPSAGYVEPTLLLQIREVRPKGFALEPVRLGEETLYDKVYGGWLGRSAGCMLGKPVEGWDEKEKIDAYLKRVGAYPLSDYFPEGPQEPDEPQLRFPEALKGNVTRALRDDDLDYTILGLHYLKTHGMGFTSQDVAAEWLQRLPYHMVYTAERFAYKNLVLGLKPPASGVFRNPCREWIGAQIRADAFGYVSPGLPEAAAALAHRDAVVSHTKNGVYGEMFVAAMIAAAFVTDDLHTIIDAGLAEIPEKSRLTEAIRHVIRWCADDGDWQATHRRVMEAYGHYHAVHTINNACMVVLALLYGQRDFESTITIAVNCGLDTDCNGATAGSIVGVVLGAQSLPEKWIGPLNDRLESSVMGYTESRISQLAAETTTIARTALEDAGHV